MNEPKFTKGPYKSSRVDHVDGMFNVTFESGPFNANDEYLNVSVVSCTNSEHVANLFASSPDLYESVEELLELCHAEPNGEEIRRKAIAALSKARGES